MASPLPPEALIQNILDRLDAFVSAAGTLEIHDALYAMLRERDEAMLPVLAAALSDHPDHPLRGEISVELSPWLLQRPLTLEDVLLQDGPLPPDVDPIHEVRRRLLRAQEVRRVLEARITGLERGSHLLNNTANGMAAVAAFLAVFALTGWLAALGVWQIPWLETPELPSAPEEPAPTQTPPE